MHRWLRPRSRGFRVVLGMAFVAWAALLASAFAAPWHGFDPMAMATASMTTLHAPARHCAGTVAQQAGTLHVPVAPIGHGVCCHGGCLCLTVCNAALTVPRLTMVTVLACKAVPVLASVKPAHIAPAPPLRPPIA